MSNFNDRTELSSDKIKSVILVTFMIGATGSLITVIWGSFDLTSHLLQIPETFFTIEHLVLYSGICMMMICAVICLFLLTLKKQVRTSQYSRGLKMIVIGASVLLISGPLDFWWHDTFGFDGLLGPAHVSLVFGIITLMLGCIIGLVKMTKEFPTRKNIIKPFLAIAFVTFLWNALMLIFSFSTPFSKGEIFDFTPDPYVAVTIALISTPFLISVIFWSVSKTFNRFGAVSIVALLVLLINIVTGIIPVDGLHVYLPWFIIPMVGVIIADYLIHNKKYHILQDHSEKIAGSIIGAVSFMIFFPWVGPTYLRLYVTDDINTYDILPTSELLVAEIWLLIVIPCAIIGMLGMLFAKRKLKIISIE